MTSFKSRRFSQQKKQNIHHVIAFSLGEDWYACSVFSVIKVISLETIYGRAQGSYLGLTRYQDKEILVLNMDYYLGLTRQISQDYAYLLIVQLANDLTGIPLNQPPIVYRVPDNNLVDLPDSYVVQSNQKCFHSKIIKMPDLPPIFMIDIDKLLIL